MKKGQHVLLTGLPGVGKTTLVRKVVDELKKSDHPNITGFYTEEIRDQNLRKRTGFQVVNLSGQRATLSSIRSDSSYRVGNYGVEITEFESIAIPSITKVFPTDVGVRIVIIDEIGKMELFSKQFIPAVEKAFSEPNTVILATIPVPSKGKPITFVEKIREMPGAKLITVDRNNRDGLLSEVINVLLGHGQT